jgi:inhibitor of cysteine peptidase
MRHFVSLSAGGPLAAFARAIDEKADQKGQENKAAVVITERDGGGAVMASKGDTVLLELTVRGGTGYQWAVAANNNDVLQPQGQPATRPITRSDQPLPGGPALQVFTFRAVAQGTSQLELHYRRPFEKDREPARKFTVTVSVQ